MRYLQIYTGIIRAAVRDKRQRDLYAYEILRAYSQSTRGFITLPLALRHLTRRMDVSRLTARRLLRRLSKESWIKYYRDSKHYHIKSINHVKMVVSPHSPSTTHIPNRTALASYDGFKAWCTSAISDDINRVNYAKMVAKFYAEQVNPSNRQCSALEPSKDRLEACRTRVDIGEISCRYYAAVVGVSVSTAWRHLKEAEKYKFITIKKNFCPQVDNIKIRTTDQLEAYIRKAELLSDEEMHKFRFVYDEKRKYYRFLTPSIVDTKKIYRSRRKIDKAIWNEIKPMESSDMTKILKKVSSTRSLQLSSESLKLH